MFVYLPEWYSIKVLRVWTGVGCSKIMNGIKVAYRSNEFSLLFVIWFFFHMRHPPPPPHTQENLLSKLNGIYDASVSLCVSLPSFPPLTWRGDSELFAKMDSYHPRISLSPRKQVDYDVSEWTKGSVLMIFHTSDHQPRAPPTTRWPRNNKWNASGAWHCSCQKDVLTWPRMFPCCGGVVGRGEEPAVSLLPSSLHILSHRSRSLQHEY